jgi:hypothetical protein
MAQRYYLRAACHKYSMGGRQRGKPKTGRGGKKLWLPYVPHGMKWNKSSKSVCPAIFGISFYRKIAEIN